jgi:methylisocitrate lyase
MNQRSPGARFRAAVQSTPPLAVAGSINAYCAILAQSAGFKAIYLSGAGVANASFGLPDLGMTNASDVAEDARRITAATELPLLVDIDTGWGHAFNIGRSIKMMEAAGVAAVHIEDQIQAKRCGHRPNKAIVSKEEMGDRIKAAVDARKDESFVIMARTDAYAQEGKMAALERLNYCIELGADMVFPEAIYTLEDYAFFTKALSVPVLANITEFGKTPLFDREDLKKSGVSIILYPLSAFRAMSQAALDVYKTIIKQGSQKSLLDDMQTREMLYEMLGYYQYEKKMDELMEEKHD